MARGQEAKDRVIQKLKEAFGDKFIGESDKKIYVWSQENGAPMQIAISLTCPKTPIETIDTMLDFGSSDGGLNFDNITPIPVAVNASNAAEISPEEKQVVLDLMAKLGL